MPKLTRRRYAERPDCWHVYYGDVCVGTIARRVGCPADLDQWEWGCGFYPGTERGQRESGTAIDLETCRIEFEAAWQRLLPTFTEAGFQGWGTSGTARPRNTQRGTGASGCRRRDFNNALPMRRPIC
jgi:hypothetical protein